MSAPFILDTNILVHFVRGDRVWQRIRKADSPLLAEPQPIISVITDGELRSLAYQFNWQSDKLSQMNFALGYFQRVSIDHPHSLEAYAVIDSFTLSQGQPMGKNDLWLAATAPAMGAKLVTTDKDFDVVSPIFIERILVDPTT